MPWIAHTIGLLTMVWPSGFSNILQTIMVITMNQVKNSLKESDRSWSIHIYNGRHLIGSLYPSHAWIFLLGATLSGLIIFAGSPAQPSRPASSNSSQAPRSSQAPQSAQVHSPFQVD